MRSLKPPGAVHPGRGHAMERATQLGGANENAAVPSAKFDSKTASTSVPCGARSCLSVAAKPANHRGKNVHLGLKDNEVGNAPALSACDEVFGPERTSEGTTLLGSRGNDPRRRHERDMRASAFGTEGRAQARLCFGAQFRVLA